MTKKTIAVCSAVLLLTTGAVRAAHIWDDSSGGWSGRWSNNGNAPKYTGDELSLDLFGSYLNPEHRFQDLFQSNIRHGVWGGGAGLNYFFTENFGIEGDVNLSDHPGRIVDQVLGNGVLRLPLGNSGLAIYGIGGAGRAVSPSWEWVYDGGAGLEFRFNPGMGIFSDARYIWADRTFDRLLIRAGIRLTF